MTRIARPEDSMSKRNYWQPCWGKLRFSLMVTLGGGHDPEGSCSTMWPYRAYPSIPRGSQWGGC
jgi:hypothetical protein